MAPVERRSGSLPGSRLVALALSGLPASFASTSRCAVALGTLVALLLGGHSAVRAQTKETISNYENIQIHPSNVHQTEMSIATNPLDGLVLLVGANTETNNGQGSYLTADGCLNWVGSDTLPVGWADPTVAFDAAGNAFFSHMSAVAGKYVISVSRSTDHGASWDTVVHVPDPDPPPYLAKTDKPHMAIDTGLASNYRNRIYVGYTDVYSTHLFFSRCSTYSAGFTVPDDWTAGSNSLYDFGVNIATAPNGNVYVCWSRIDSTLAWTEFNVIGFRRSTDGGANFDSAVRITDTAMRGLGAWTAALLKTAHPSGGIRVWTLPSMAVDASGGTFDGRIYVAWVDKRHGDPDIILTKSRDEGATWDTVVRVNDDLEWPRFS